MTNIIKCAKMLQHTLRVGYLGKLGIVMPGVLVCGRMSGRTFRVLFCDEEDACTTDKVRMLLITPIEKMHYAMTDRQSSKKNLLLLGFAVILFGILEPIS